MRELVVQWYAILGSLNAVVALPLREMAAAAELPLLSALLLGLIGATSPCQITTNLSALAYLGRNAGSRAVMARGGLAYLLGKALVYTLLGTAVILAGQQFAQASIPFISTVRKVVGPVMVLLGLHLLGVLPLRFAVGQRWSGWLEERSAKSPTGPFLLGGAFGLAFCPTLFLLFFGLTIPLALTAPLGILYPAAFAAGATLPLLVALALIGALGVQATRSLASASRKAASRLQPIAAAVILLAGINDTILYWIV